VKNPGCRDFFWGEKILGTRIYRENFLGVARPIKTLIGILIWGEFAVGKGGGDIFCGYVVYELSLKNTEKPILMFI
jgi:hypothetical protein